jgi:hypothetical protein
MKLSKKATKGLIKNYFSFKHRLPAGTDISMWEKLTMKEMAFDDPPLPAAPDLEKNRIADEIQDVFALLDIRIDSILDILKDGSKTMKELWQHCYSTQDGV